MKISQLQSIIKRNGNAISWLEEDISLNFNLARELRAYGEPWSFIEARDATEYAHKLKRKLKKLVALQKALKKEIAFEIEYACNEMDDWLFSEIFNDLEKQ